MNYPNGHEFEFRPLKPSQIKFSDLYQRDLDLKRCRDIANEFDGDIFNEPKVSYRNGQFWCFDGMHSVHSWKILHNNQDVPVNCKVFRGMTELDEINCFVKQTGNKKDLQIGDKLKAMEAARDPDVLKMKRGIEQFGFTVNYGRNNSGSTTAVNCHAQALRSYKSLQYEEYLLVWSAIRDLWYKQRDSTSQKVVKGLTEFYRLYSGKFEYRYLVDHLRNVPISTLLQNAEKYGDRKGKYQFKHPYAFAIGEKYNFNLRSSAIDLEIAK